MMKTVEHDSGVYSFEIEDEDFESYEGLTAEKLRQDGASDEFIETVSPYLDK